MMSICSSTTTRARKERSKQQASRQTKFTAKATSNNIRSKCHSGPRYEPRTCAGTGKDTKKLVNSLDRRSRVRQAESAE